MKLSKPQQELVEALKQAKDGTLYFSSDCGWHCYVPVNKVRYFYRVTVNTLLKLGVLELVPPANNIRIKAEPSLAAQEVKPDA